MKTFEMEVSYRVVSNKVISREEQVTYTFCVLASNEAEAFEGMKVAALSKEEYYRGTPNYVGLIFNDVYEIEALPTSYPYILVDAS